MGELFKPVTNTNMPCSICAGALLLDARQLFEQQNAKADEALRSIVGQLPEAVTSCVDAAGADMEPVRQTALMKVSNGTQRTPTSASVAMAACF